MHDKAILNANKNKINIKDNVRNNNSKKSQCYNRKLDEFYVESTIGKSALNLTGPQHVKKRYFLCDN
ncbi:TTF-type domain-containing protein [Aphis craccivora]|uniref:TTF-type domain-containing protein n=1 Tax=Aphis craccivora TaxID=307492 RepID=A0A6G0VTM2_APHCR|nr:TTF-type domain-containing protein [Aphis craccivora]